MITKSKFLLLCLHLALFHYAQGQSLVINEFMADNDPLTQIVDEVGQSDDWIELHNTTNTTINIGGYFLSDELGQLDKWQIPAGQSIGAFGYKIIWADADASQGPLHASFKLSKTGESIYLTNANAVILDSINYPVQTTSISYARIPNGTGNFDFRAPTFGYNNEATSGTHTPVNKAAFKVFPNPATHTFTIQWTETQADETLQISIWDALGQLLHSEQLKRAGNETTTSINIQQYTSGLYYVQLEAERYHSVELLLVD
jgi:Lamin Tail Domain/Secretion system C-terminal sorting domain